MIDTRRLVWEHDAESWSVIVDGKRLANDRSLKSAIDAAYSMTRA
jgi:hypothetical protein